MRRYMTMEDFLKEFYPGISQRKFASLMGGNETIVSKMINSQNYNLECDSAKIITNWILQHHNVIIIYDSPEYKVEKDYQEKFDAIIKQKDEKIAELEAIIKDLQMKLEFDTFNKKYREYYEGQIRKEIRKESKRRK